MVGIGEISNQVGSGNWECNSLSARH